MPDLPAPSSQAGPPPAEGRRAVRDWQAALDRLYGFANWETRPPGAPHEFALDRIERLLAALGQPHHAWPAVHVGGTNGKGSTCALLASALQAAGYRVGLYTSPHMHTVRERVRVDGALISQDAVMAWLNAHGALLDSLLGLTTFEALTACAFDHFAAERVDIAVIEVGLGGRLDTTRVVRPIVSVLTPIGLDHREILGDTLRQIASDKVGIFVPGVSVVSAPQAPEARAVILAESKRLGCPLTLVGRDVTWRVQPVQPAASGTALPVLDISVDLPPRGDPLAYTVAPSLLGPHQHVNAVVAATALAVLQRAGWNVAAADVAAGFAQTEWPGRYERFSAPNQRTLVIDGAHNPHGAAALVSALDAVDPAPAYVFVLGFGGGKDVDGMLDVLLKRAAHVFTVRADHPKALSAAAVADRVRARQPTLAVDPAPSVMAAIDAALAVAGPGGTVVACGSIFVAADAREAWCDSIGRPIAERDAPRPEAEAAATTDTARTL